MVSVAPCTSSFVTAKNPSTHPPIFTAPKHPYTRALLAAVPDIDPDRVLAPAQLRGEPPSPLDLPAGCPFHPRCPHAQEICAQGVPPALRQVGDAEVACHFDLPSDA